MLRSKEQAQGALVERLRQLVPPDALLTSPEDLACYAYDGTWYEYLPDVVVTPNTTEQVAAILKLANAERIPVVPRGAGSGLAGGSIPIEGGIVLSLARMNRILEIDTVNTVAVVQPGVLTAELQAAVERLGLFYPPDPASLRQSTLGGNVAMSAGGPRCLKYGTTKDYVLGLEVVLANGEVLRTGGKAIKNVTGYNLCQLFTGSEGTLGVITEITLRLLPLPRARRTLMAIFPRLEDASRLVTEVLGAGILPATMELMDSTAIHCVEEYLHMGLPLDVEAILVIEVDGDEAVVDREIDAVDGLCRQAGASEVRRATTAEEAELLWQARRAVSGAMGRMRPNKLGEDIAVPRSAIVPMVRRIREIATRYHLPIVTFGHIGDGNLHPNILFDKRDAEEVERVHQAAGAILAAAVELGGTLSGEHGIGLAKRDYLAIDLHPQAIDVMKRIKKALDPNGILNPGKIFP